ncbi:carbohydrate ABC transporter permease [Pararhizobium sp.]|uniref:carbohydrate ABC transporter permease n=1 Tax=Pararhizobium sp. TaxID=1977563 RepID=UPI00271A5DAE|nr:sugar ABC transporter permease [Pararhizobium sp.]MDO9415062.1 sugar ABC transporter permease [Pararhizobium sp.]
MASPGAGAARRSYDINGWLFVSIALGLIAVFSVYPIVQSLLLSFYSGKGMQLKFIGFGNIVRLWNDPVFIKALSNTMIFFVVQVPIMLFLAILMAATLNSPHLKFRGLFRTMIFLPCISSLVTYSVLFKSMFSVDGVVNTTLANLGLISSPLPWLTDPFWAKVLIIIAITWRWVGYNMIFFLAAMQNIDKSIYEAAHIDGVPARSRFLWLTVPMLKPVILFTAVTSTIGTLQLFDEPMNITGGGPADSTLTMSLYIYNLTFKFVPNFGYAATVSYVIVVLVALLAFLQFYAAKDRD